MTSRDLYAACVGLSTGLAGQCLVQYLARPSIWIALCLLVLMFSFLTAVAAYVTSIVAEHAKTLTQETIRKPASEAVRPVSSRVAPQATASTTTVPSAKATDDIRSSDLADAAAVN